MNAKLMKTLFFLYVVKSLFLRYIFFGLNYNLIEIAYECYHLEDTYLKKN